MTLLKILSGIAGVFVISCEALAGDTRPAFDFAKAMQIDEGVYTKETFVQLDGQKYRKIEIENEVYYVKMLAPEDGTGDMGVICGEETAQSFNNGAPALVSGAVRITKSARLFVEGLRAHCTQDAHGNSYVNLQAMPAIGIKFDDSDDPNAVLKNRTISIVPFQGLLGFTAEW